MVLLQALGSWQIKKVGEWKRKKKGIGLEVTLGEAGSSFPPPKVDSSIQPFLAEASLCGTFSFAEKFRKRADCLEIPSVNFGFASFD